MTRAVQHGAQILAQARTAKRETRLEVCAGNVQLVVHLEDFHHAVAVDPGCFAE